MPNYHIPTPPSESPAESLIFFTFFISKQEPRNSNSASPPGAVGIPIEIALSYIQNKNIIGILSFLVCL
jgi:hypothetical protein